MLLFKGHALRLYSRTHAACRHYGLMWLEMSNVVFRDINLTSCDIPPRPALA